MVSQGLASKSDTHFESIWFKAFLSPPGTNVVHSQIISWVFTSTAEILAERSNLTPQRAKNSLINRMRYRSPFRRKAYLLRTFPLVSPETSKLEWAVVCSEKKNFCPSNHFCCMQRHAQRKIISMKEDLIGRHIETSYSSRFITKTLWNETLMNTSTRKRHLEYKNSDCYYKRSPRLQSSCTLEKFTRNLSITSTCVLRDVIGPRSEYPQ